MPKGCARYGVHHVRPLNLTYFLLYFLQQIELSLIGWRTSEIQSSNSNHMTQKSTKVWNIEALKYTNQIKLLKLIVKLHWFVSIFIVLPNLIYTMFSFAPNFHRFLGLLCLLRLSLFCTFVIL